MTTQYTTDPTLIDLLRAFFERGVDFREVDMDREQCEWCGDVGAVTTVRIYGQPREDVLLPVDQVEVCGTCAIPLIKRAKAEARDDAGDIVIEVAR